MKTPEEFIKNFRKSFGSKSDCIKVFTEGYCYYFARVLQNAFNRGSIYFEIRNGLKDHIVWVDIDSNIYDISGKRVSHGKLIKVENEKQLKEFKHI